MALNSVSESRAGRFIFVRLLTLSLSSYLVRRRQQHKPRRPNDSEHNSKLSLWNSVSMRMKASRPETGSAGFPAKEGRRPSVNLTKGRSGNRLSHCPVYAQLNPDILM
ncbi:hypothetical protein J6590_038496 [Homalodisca vitripennis]|nr:hypothetical protein J6590_038496 [Homalodisca vitripennis]